MRTFCKDTHPTDNSGACAWQRSNHDAYGQNGQGGQAALLRAKSHAKVQHAFGPHCFAATLLIAPDDEQGVEFGGQSASQPGGQVGSLQQSCKHRRSQSGGQFTSQPGGQVGSSQQQPQPSDCLALVTLAASAVGQLAQPKTVSGNAATRPKSMFRRFIRKIS